MKTISALFITLLLAGNIQAGNSTGELSKQIKSSLIMPESMKQNAALYPNGQKVTVSFVVNEQGNVTEASAKTKDMNAKKDLEQQFMKLNFKDLKSGVQHEIDINFVIL